MPAKNTNIARDQTKYTKNLIQNVDEKFTKINVISGACYAKLGRNGLVDHVEARGPTSTPLDKFLNSPEIKAGLIKACEETAMMLYDDNLKEEIEAKRKDLDEKRQENEIPIYAMSAP